MTTHTKETILIIEDEPIQLKLIEHMVKQLGYHALTAPGGKEAINLITSDQGKYIDVVLLDLFMPDIDGKEVLETIRPIYPNLPVIVLTAHGELDLVVEAMRLGADDFLTKPAQQERLKVSINTLLRIRSLSEEVQRLERSNEKRSVFGDVIGSGPEITESIHLAKRAASSDIPIFIQGESGVGKELFAQAIHASSNRSEKPFIALNCGTISDTLAESILFGHEKGAFTGAISKSLGKFREAEGGTLFLDEIGELKLDLQVKLLRALQEKEIQPVGSTGSIKTNVRIVSATNRDLKDLIKEGRFREDLYYRLTVFPLYVPPLRKRKEDLLDLIMHFIKRISAIEKKNITGISNEAYDLLYQYQWPGNIRELENAIFRAVVLCKGNLLEKADFIFLSMNEETRLASPSQKPSTQPSNIASDEVNNSNHISIQDKDGRIKTLAEIEAEAIQYALKANDGHVQNAARQLGVGKDKLYKKRKKLVYN